MQKRIGKNQYIYLAFRQLTADWFANEAFICYLKTVSASNDAARIKAHRAKKRLSELGLLKRGYLPKLRIELSMTDVFRRMHSSPKVPSYMIDTLIAMERNLDRLPEDWR